MNCLQRLGTLQKQDLSQYLNYSHPKKKSKATIEEKGEERKRKLMTTVKKNTHKENITYEANQLHKTCKTLLRYDSLQRYSPNERSNFSQNIFFKEKGEKEVCLTYSTARLPNIPKMLIPKLPEQKRQLP